MAVADQKKRSYSPPRLTSTMPLPGSSAARCFDRCPCDGTPCARHIKHGELFTIQDTPALPPSVTPAGHGCGKQPFAVRRQRIRAAAQTYVVGELMIVYFPSLAGVSDRIDVL